jgi:hypothetical protein
MAWQPTSWLARRHASSAAAIAAAFILSACSSASHGSASAGGRPTPAWLLTRSALAELTADPAARDLLRHSRVLEVLRPGQRPLPGSTADPVAIFTSAVALEDAIRGGRIPRRAYGVLYDPEAWAFTPAAEQRDPVRAAAAAAATAHAHGLRLIAAPALNLTTVVGPRRGGPRWRRFLDSDLVARMARVADAIELQAQSLERSRSTYATFVRAATSQASAVKPSIEVFAGLSTNPPGAPVVSRHLTGAIQATRSVVDGYWLNVPGPGERCPSCNDRRPEIAIETLRSVH